MLSTDIDSQELLNIATILLNQNILLQYQFKIMPTSRQCVFIHISLLIQDDDFFQVVAVASAVPVNQVIASGSGSGTDCKVKKKKSFDF